MSYNLDDLPGATQITDVDERGVPRNRYGHAMVRPDGEKRLVGHVRPSSYGKPLDSAHGLMLWTQRMTTWGAVVRPDLFARLSALGPPNENNKREHDRLNAELKEAAAASAGANKGTAQHGYLERIDRGDKDVVVLEGFRDDVKAYRTTLSAAGIEIVPDLIECFVVHPGLQAAGSPDRYVRHRGRLKTFDIKTGSIGFPHSWAAQLAIYAGAATGYDPMTGEHRPLPEIDQQEGLIAHVPVGEGRCDLYRIDLALGREAIEHAAWVKGWQRRRDILAPLDDPAPAGDLRAWLVGRVAWLRAHHPEVLAAVAASWPPGIPTLSKSDGHDVGQLKRILDVVLAAEAAHQLPFPDTQPPAAA